MSWENRTACKCSIQKAQEAVQLAQGEPRGLSRGRSSSPRRRVERMPIFHKLVPPKEHVGSSHPLSSTLPQLDIPALHHCTSALHGLSLCPGALRTPPLAEHQTQRQMQRNYRLPRTLAGISLPPPLPHKPRWRTPGPRT